jgi:hypothetical protein
MQDDTLDATSVKGNVVLNCCRSLTKCSCLRSTTCEMDSIALTLDKCNWTRMLLENSCFGNEFFVFVFGRIRLLRKKKKRKQPVLSGCRC